MQNQSYKLPVFLAIFLHSILFVALFIHWLPKMHLGEGEQVQIVNATLIQEHAVQGVRIQTPPKTIVSKPKPPVIEKTVQQKSIEKPLISKPISKPVVKVEPQKKEPPKIVKNEHKSAEKIVHKDIEKPKQQEQQNLQKQLQAEQQKIMQQQMAQEEKQLTAAASSLANDQKLQSEIDKYKALIVATISQNWLVPDNVDKNISCELLIGVGPGGSVLNVQVTRSSGNSQLDQSATEAVFKSSPLPVPTDPELFDKFRTLRLTVKPQNVVSN